MEKRAITQGKLPSLETPLRHEAETPAQKAVTADSSERKRLSVGTAETLHQKGDDTGYRDDSTRDVSHESVPPSDRTERITVLPSNGFMGSKTDHPVLKFPIKRRYEIREPLGEGSMGRVDVAYDADIQREIAIKRLKRSDDPVAIARLTDEIRISGQLEHPNIVPVHDVGLNASGDYFFIMRKVNGITLREIIEGLQRGDNDINDRFPISERLRIFRDIVAAVNYAHSQNILHGDLKPENLMVGEYGEVFVMDWGIARVFDVKNSDAQNPKDGWHQDHPSTSHLGSTRKPLIQGTPWYMAPEQVQGQLTVRSELYTLCVILHELLCLEHYLGAFRDLQSIFQGIKTVPVPTMLNLKTSPYEKVPVEWSHFVSKGTAKKAEERFESAQHLLDAFDHVEQGFFAIQCPTTLTKQGLLRLVRLIDRYPLAGYLLPLGLLMATLAIITSSLLTP